MCLFLVVTVFSAQREKLVLSTGFPQEEALIIKSIMKEVSRRAGYELEFQILPMERSLINANEGMNDGEAARIWEINKQYPNLYRVPVQSYSIDLVLLSKKDIKIDKTSDLKKYHLGVVRGIKIAERIAKKTGSLSVTKSVNNTNLLKMLNDGRLDVIIVNKISLFSDLKGLKKGTFYMKQTPIMSRPLYIQLHTGSLLKREALEKALQSMHEDGTYDEIRNAFSKSIEQNLPSSVRVILYG